jgi:2-polyprenyl-3-methyl-5-hydroxy-6-metoxy-1,4-benzoquinol methylase
VLGVIDPAEAEHDVITGALVCAQCGVYYPIYRGIARMLTYPTEVAQVHARENAKWIAAELSRVRLPSATAPPGEEATLRNFSTEWQGYEWNGDTYWNTTPENMLNCMRYMLGVDKRAIRRKVLLEVGIGVGGIADALARSEGCEVVGMDLGHAVDQAQRFFGNNVLLHIVQASIFAPPFRHGTFDVVYSQGVLHHTYSTRAAFSKIASLPKTDAGMLYVWVYSHEQERATLLRRLLMVVERIVRPVLSSMPTPLQTASLLPAVLVYMVYQNLYSRRQLGPGYGVSYGFTQALHAARDRLTPPFAHRHSYEEVAEWFRSESYEDLEFLRNETRPRGVPETFSINIGVRGFRKSAA